MRTPIAYRRAAAPSGGRRQSRDSLVRSDLHRAFRSLLCTPDVSHRRLPRRPGASMLIDRRPALALSRNYRTF